MRGILKLGGLALGTTLGGLLAGLCEAIYRDAPWGYAALLYGCMWAIAGAGVAALLGLVGRPRAIQRSLTTTGLALALGVSGLVLARFVAHRDVFAEAPDKAMLASLIGLVVGTGLAVLALMGGAWVRKRFLADRLPGPWLWSLPALVFVLFIVRAQTNDDAVSTSAPEARRLGGRGVILIVVDTLRADALGAYGALAHRGAPPSPRIDALAATGAVFTNVGAQASWTRPAVASILTSRHPSGHDTMNKAAILPRTLPSIATELSKAGVATAAVVSNYNLEASYGFANGFSHFRYLAPARYLGAPEAASRLAAYNVDRLLRERFLTGSREPDYFYRSGAVVNAAGLTLLDEIGDKDFFLWLHYMDPHDPYFAVDGRSYARVSSPRPPAALADEMRAAYGDNVRRLDQYIGELTSALEARGLLANTTIVLTADHGEEFAEHGGFYHGTTLYEEQLHVPLIAVGRNITAAQSTTLARQLDVAPTVLGLYALPPPPSWEGRDLFGPTAPPEMILAEEDHEGNVLKSIRHGGRKLIVANDSNPRGLLPVELYDLTKDPREQYPAKQGGEIERLSAALNEQLEASKRGGARSAAKAMDAATEAELRSLGYVQ
jgi:arylsulfatase A-like enzyme